MFESISSKEIYAPFLCFAFLVTVSMVLSTHSYSHFFMINGSETILTWNSHSSTSNSSNKRTVHLNTTLPSVRLNILPVSLFLHFVRRRFLTYQSNSRRICWTFLPEHTNGHTPWELGSLQHCSFYYWTPAIWTKIQIFFLHVSHVKSWIFPAITRC